MARYVCILLAALILYGCDDGGSGELPEGYHKTDLFAYVLVRDVSAGEKLDMTMLKPATTITDTVDNDTLKELFLTSAEIDAFLGKPFNKDVKEGDILEKELFQ